jgi:hypothetical protein
MLNKTSAKVGVVVSTILLIIVIATLAQSEISTYSPIIFGPSLYFLGPNESEPNNSFEQANGILLSDTDYFGLPNDPDDFFSFKNGTIGEVKINVTGLAVSEGQIIVYHEPEGSPPQVVATTDTPPPDFEVLLTRAAPGTYYVVVHIGPAGLRQDTPYTLRVAYQPVPTPTPGPQPSPRPTEGASPTPTEKPTKVGEPTATPTEEGTARPTAKPSSTPNPTPTKKP